MIVKARVFELSSGNNKNLPELARAMGISVSQVYRVRGGERSANQKFIVGAIRAFLGYKLDDLFYLAPESLAIGKRNSKEKASTKSSWLALTNPKTGL